MASDEDGTEVSGPRVRASLRIELETGERQVVATFREGVLKWLNDRSGSAFARALGAPDRLSFEELQADAGGQGTPMLRLNASWSQPGDHTATAAAFSADQVRTPGTDLPSDSLVFFPDSPGQTRPIYRGLEVPLGVDLPPRSADGSPQLRMQTPAGAMINNARQLAGSLDSAMFGAHGSNTGRVRLKGLAALGAAAVVAGFIVGTFYLSGTRARGPVAPAPSASAAAPQVATAAATATAAGPDASISAFEPILPVPGPLTAAADRAALTVAASAVVEPAQVRARLPDTEVRRPRPVAKPTRPALIRRAAPVVVRAIEDVRTTASASGSRREMGALVVGSDPQGAEVSINGIPHGRTPLMIRGLGAGSRVLRLDLPGYRRWSWAVAVVANKQTPVKVKLQPESRGTASQQ